MKVYANKLKHCDKTVYTIDRIAKSSADSTNCTYPC